MTIKQQGGVFGRNPSFNTVGANAVGVGTSTPAEEVEIRASVPTLRLTDSDNNAYSNFLHNSGSLSIDVDPTQAGSSSKFSVKTDGTLRMEIGTTGDLTVSTGNLVIGTSGKGIDFSATSGTGTSELFNDYEEGTFTPVVADAASGGNVATASSAYGYYTKVGRVVTVTIDLQNINTTGLTSGNDIFITGLPFLAASLTGNMNYTAPVNGGGTLTSAKSVIAVVYDSNDYIRLVDAVSATVTGWLDVSEINSGATDFRFSVTYFA